MSTGAGFILLVGRIIFSISFLMAGYAHFRRSQMMTDAARSRNFPLAAFAGWPAGVYLIVGGLSILLGVWPDVGALLIAIWVIPTALYFHNFWSVADPVQQQAQRQLFLRNLTYLGAAIALFAIFGSAGSGLRFALTAPLIDF